MDWQQEKTLLELDVANLTVRLGMVRKELAKARRACRRKRVPVLVRVDANGDVSIYARDADVEVVAMPRDLAGPRAMTLAEEWVDVNLPEPHRDLHLPGYCVATVNSRACRSVAETYEAAQTQAAHETLNNLKGKQNAPTKDSDTRAALGSPRNGVRGSPPTRRGSRG